MKLNEIIKDFYIHPYSPVEFIYDMDFNIIGQYIIIRRKYYPAPIYIKIVNNKISEIYPLLLKDSIDFSIDVIKNNIPYSDFDFEGRYNYFSWNLKDEKIDEIYYPDGEKEIKLFKGQELKTLYKVFNKIDDCQELSQDIKNKIKELNPSYVIVSIRNNTVIRFIVGYDISNIELWKEKKEFNLKNLDTIEIE